MFFQSCDLFREPDQKIFKYFFRAVTWLRDRPESEVKSSAVFFRAVTCLKDRPESEVMGSGVCFRTVRIGQHPRRGPAYERQRAAHRHHEELCVCRAILPSW